MTATTSIDEERLHALLGQAVVEFGATVNAALVVIGDRLGLYRELAANGPLTSEELAERTGTAERYVREWLNAQAASGWIGHQAGLLEQRGDALAVGQRQALRLGHRLQRNRLLGALAAELDQQPHAVFRLRGEDHEEKAYQRGRR